MIRVRLREAMDSHRQHTGERLALQKLALLTGLSFEAMDSLSPRRGYNTTLNTIAKLCEVLNCRPSDLLVFESHRPNGPPR